MGVDIFLHSRVEVLGNGIVIKRNTHTTMISLFGVYPHTSVGVVHPQNWNYVKSGYKRNLSKVKTYYHLYHPAVAPDHFLVKLIQSIAVPVTLPLEKYYDTVDSETMRISLALKMTSPYSQGQAFSGIFYDKSCSEVLLVSDDYFDIADTYQNWRDSCAVRVLMHPKSDMQLALPAGKKYSQESGFCLIEINIPKLMVMYKGFVTEQAQRLEAGAEASESIMQFIGGYVLPNMLESQTEVCLFNRFYNAVHQIPQPERVASTHSFNLVYLEADLDMAVDKVVENLAGSKPDFSTLLHTLPSIQNKNLYESLIMPDVIATQQVDWALVGARLKVLDFLITVSGANARTTNEGVLAQAIRSLKRNNAYAVMKNTLSAQALEEFDSYRNRLFKAAGVTPY